MPRLVVALFFVALVQVAYSTMLVDGSDSLVIRAKRSETVEGSGEGSGEIAHALEGSGETVESSGEGSGSEPVVESKPAAAAEPSLLTETKETKPAEEIAKF